MKRALCILIFLCSPALAEGPIFHHADKYLDQEIKNIYNDIRGPRIGVGSASTMTVAQLNVSTITISGTPANANDAAKFSQIKYFQIVTSSSTASTSTTSTTFVDTVLKRNITPTSASSKILILAASEIGGLVASKSAFITIARNGTDLSGGSGFSSDILVNASGAFRQPWAAAYLDSPATTSATSYSIQIKNGVAGGINLNDNGGVATMYLVEVQ